MDYDNDYEQEDYDLGYDQNLDYDGYEQGDYDYSYDQNLDYDAGYNYGAGYAY